jgi:hypothetical protein
MRRTRTEHRVAATFAPRATRAADAAARAPDVTPAQGGWGEEPGEEGGTTEKQEATLPLPDASPLCFRNCFRLLFFLAGVSGFSCRQLSFAIPEASSPICVPVSPFLHANVLGAHSVALPPQLPWRDHPLPACACAHSIVDVQHHSPGAGQAAVHCGVWSVETFVFGVAFLGVVQALIALVASTCLAGYLLAAGALGESLGGPSSSTRCVLDELGLRFAAWCLCLELEA